MHSLNNNNNNNNTCSSSSPAFVVVVVVVVVVVDCLATPVTGTRRTGEVTEFYRFLKRWQLRARRICLLGSFFCIFFYICSYFVWQPPPTQTIGSGQNELAFPFHGQLDFFKNNPKIDSSFSRLPERISNRFDKVFDWKAFRPLDWLIFGSSDDQFNHLFSDFFLLWYRRLPSVDGFSFLRNGMERRFFLWQKKNEATSFFSIHFTVAGQCAFNRITQRVEQDLFFLFHQRKIEIYIST